MRMEELQIIPPKGYEIDKENSTFECIKFKKKLLTYEDVAEKLFNPHRYFINGWDEIQELNLDDDFCANTNATSKKQLEKLLAINKLMNVAKYLNGDWQPDFTSMPCDQAWYIYITFDNHIAIYHTVMRETLIYFKTRELAQQAIDILGEKIIRLALSTDW